MSSQYPVDTEAEAIDYLSDLTSVLRRVPRAPLGAAIAALLEARALGKRIYVAGNGGSAATASHFVCDLVKTAEVGGFRPFRAFALTDNTPLMTAWANDVAFEETFPRMIEGLVESGDVVICISASGNSTNIVQGLIAANALGARTIALLGFDGGAALDIAEIAVHVPCTHYGLAEDAHSAIGHAIANAIKKSLQTAREQSVMRLLDADTTVDTATGEAPSTVAGPA